MGNMYKEFDLKHFRNEEYKPYIFISYSHRDEGIVKKIQERLEEAGYCVWIDYNNLRLGCEYNSEIQNAIVNCSLFLQCISSAYLDDRIGAYCELECTWAISSTRTRIPIYLEDVRKIEFNKYTKPINKHALGVKGELCDDFESQISILLNDPCLLELKVWMENQNGIDVQPMPFVSNNKALFRVLMSHCEKVSKRSGNYVLGKIHNELFPDLNDISHERVYRCSDNSNISLYNFLIQEENAKKLVLLKGDGGMGKTVSMLETCKKMLDDGYCAVYVPLNAVKFSENTGIMDYIKDTICYNELIWKNLQQWANTEQDDFSKRVIFFMDGVNEIPNLECNIGDIADNLLKNRNSQFVFASRDEFPKINREFEEAHTLEMLPLDDCQVEVFLRKRGMTLPENLRIKNLLGNPLLLCLYVDSETVKKSYLVDQNKYGINFESEPDTAGKIIHNFLHTQLYRVASGKNEDYPSCYVLIEYVLPKLAYLKAYSESNSLEYKDVIRCIRLIFKSSYQKYEWFEDDVLTLRRIDGFSGKEINELYDKAVKEYHFLIESEDNRLDFWHQEFSDYFAAYHIVNELKMLEKDNDRYDCDIFDIAKNMLNKNILVYCAEITGENNARPYSDEDGWHFPGKEDGRKPSEYSCVEKILKIFKGKYDEKSVQTAVANLMEIMRIGRDNCLANCDFSNLDLRECNMNGCHFSEFYNDKIYSCNFTGSYIDKTFLLNESHSDELCVICSGKNGVIFSADQSGIIRLWNYKEGRKTEIFSYPGIPVDITYYGKKDLLGIAYENKVFIYDNRTKNIQSYDNRKLGNQNFRYIRFSDAGKVEITYDLSPLQWYDLESNIPIEESCNYDILAGYAKKNFQSNQIIYTQLNQQIRVIDYVENTPEGQDNDTNTGCKIRDIRLKDYSGNKKRIQVLEYNADGSKFLAGAGDSLFEIDSKTMEVTPRMKFLSDVRDARYLPDGGIVVAISDSIVILNEKFHKIDELKNMVKSDIIMFESFDEKYYLVSKDFTIKELDKELRVLRIRKSPAKGRFIWVKDKKTHELQMMFAGNKEYPNGLRFVFETGKTMHAGWCFETVVTCKNIYRREYIIKNKAATFEIEGEGKQYIYENYSGIWIYGCNFTNINGTMREKNNINLLIANGGVLNE